MALSPDAEAVRFLYRPIVFAEPDRAVSPASWLDNTPFAFWIVEALRPSRFVELGCHSGNSYASFAQAVHTLGLPAACYGVDTWRGDPHAGFFDDAVFEDWTAYHDRHFSAFSTLIRSTFDEACEHFAPGSIDLLHLDGYHTFEAASHDFDAWRSKLSRRSVVLCHDINVRERDFGVWRLWERLREEYPSFEFLHGHGLGVLGTGSDLPDAVAWLLSLRTARPECVDMVRRFFARLGGAVVARHNADTAQQQLRGELASHAEELTKKSADVERLTRELVDSNGQVAQATAEIERLGGELAASTQQLAGSTGEIERLSGELAASTQQLAGTTAEVERLRRECGEAAERLAASEAGASRVSESLCMAESALAASAAMTQHLAGSLQVFQSALDQRARHIDRLMSRIADLTRRADALATDLDARDAEIVRLRRGRDQLPRALDARDAIISALDAEAAAAVEQLQRSRPPRRRRTSAERIDPYDTSRVRLSSTSLAPERMDRPTIVMVSHVGGWKPKAGNEYRVARMLRWYRTKGYRVIPIVAPLKGGELTRDGLQGMASDVGNAIQCHRDGRIEYVLHDAPLALQSLNHSYAPSLAALLAEGAATPQQRELLSLERAFCHDVVASTVLHVSRALGPHVLQVEYIWMTRVLPLVHGRVLKVVDTHDVLSNVSDKVQTFGVSDVAITPDEEAERLRRADLAIAIQDEERRALRRIAPSLPVVTAGVDFDVVDVDRTPVPGQVFYVASNNARNRKGLDDFLRLAWPRIRRLMPHARLLVAGGVCEALAGTEVPGATFLGRVDDLTAQYQNAALVINPAVAGTGLKIKILEAMCHFRPVVTWPAGIDGLDSKLASLCRVAGDWYDFSEQVASALTAAPGRPFTDAAHAVIARQVDPKRVYRALDSAFDAFFDRHRLRDAAGQFRRRSTPATVDHAAD